MCTCGHITHMHTKDINILNFFKKNIVEKKISGDITQDSNFLSKELKLFPPEFSPMGLNIGPFRHEITSLHQALPFCIAPHSSAFACLWYQCDPYQYLSL